MFKNDYLRYYQKQVITLGINPYTHKKVVVTIEGNDRILVEAKSGSGKSLVVKNMTTQLINRPQLYLDYNGEHGLSKFPNPMSNSFNSSLFLPNLKIIKNLKFPISSHNTKYHWFTFALKEDAQALASTMMSRCASWEHIHNNDFFKFRKLVASLPVDFKSYGDSRNHPKVKGFYESYNEWVPLIHPASMPSMMRALELSESYFKSEGEEYEVLQLLKNYKHISINLDMRNYFVKELSAKMVSGILLDEISKIKNLKQRFPLVIVVEEADLLAPNQRNQYNITTKSLIERKLEEYTMKIARREHIMLIYIVQNENNLNTKIVENITKSIRFYRRYPQDNRAIFMYVDENTKRKVPFYPLDVSTMYEQYEFIYGV